MGDRFSSARAFLLISIAAGFALFPTSGLTQDAPGKAGQAPGLRSPAGLSIPRPDEAGVRRLGEQLKRLRSIGDFENAAKLFVEIFTPEPACDPRFGYKTTSSL